MTAGVNPGKLELDVMYTRGCVPFLMNTATFKCLQLRVP